jgi:hypothetical protein
MRSGAMNNWVDIGATPAPVAPSGSAFHLSRLFPLYVDETQSRMRGLKVAWYAVDNEGAITAGPYPNRDECIVRISQIPERSHGPDLWRRPDSIRAQRAA